ncbi:MAG: tetratricopeptide repeat protein, partial [Bacteroidota bacterium]
MCGKKTLLLWLTIGHLFTGMAQDRTVDSLLTLSRSATTDTARVKLMIRAAQAARRPDPRRSISIAKEALSISRKSDFQWGIAMAHRVEGNAFYDLSEYPDAMSQFEKALNGFEKMQDQAGVAAMLNGMGAIYFDKGDDTDAIALYLRAKKIAESLGDSNRVHTIESNLGAIYERKEKTKDQALLYYERALKGFKLLGRVEEYSTTSANIGEIHLESGNLALAEKYFLLAIEALPDNTTACFPLTKLGELYAQQGQLQKSAEFHQRSIRIATAQQASRELTEALVGLAKVQVLGKDYTAAIASYEQSIGISRSIETAYHRRDAYHELARLHALLGNYRQAFSYQQQLDALKDTLFNTDEQNKIQQLQFNFDLDQKQTQLDLKDLRIRQQEYFGYGAAIFLVLVVIIAIVIYQRYAFARKTNAIIQAERDRSKELLLNILPEETAHELETSGFAKTRYYGEVTVLFTDFKGFSTIAGKLTPQELVNELNKYFV